jgi:hypothetical protein
MREKGEGKEEGAEDGEGWRGCIPFQNILYPTKLHSAT